MSKHIKYTGLTNAEVLESRQKHGVNILTPPPRKPWYVQFFETFKDPLIKILLFALLLSVGIAFYEYFWIEDKGIEVILEPLGIFFAIMLATLVGFLVEYNANKKFDVLNKMNDDIRVNVIRNGFVTQIPRRDIVVGDIVLVGAGDKIPADGELLESVSLIVDESSFTGESIGRRKSHLADFEDASATYPSNVLLRGSNVKEGNGTIRVTRIGDATEYGKIYTDAKIEHDLETPLMKQFDRLGKWIARGSYVAGAAIVIGRILLFSLTESNVGLIPWVEYIIETVMLAVTLIVVSVPEGLPMSVTLSLALSMHRMLQSNNLVRKMHACETMGATTIICTDKTGTLTQNQMRVFHAHFPAIGDATSFADDEASTIVKCNLACNSTANLDKSNPEKIKAIGNPTEGALLLWLEQMGVDYFDLRESCPIEAQLPFSTENKYMATVIQCEPLGGRRLLLVKGASEIIHRYCSGVENDVPFEDITAELLGYQNKAMRTLGFAYKILDDNAPCPITEDGKLNVEGMTFMGIVAISDPVREEVPAAIRQCVDAGIQVKIVTGDTPGTAREIGRQVGLWNENDTDDSLVLGEEFANLSDDEAAQRALKIKVMARARPADKARLVSLLQKKNEVVAVTGDGTNDAPALNAAQVGLSMGDGTSVAKEASDITIMDNSFASIGKAVMWGRSLYKNIQRFIIFQLTVNVAACLLVGIGSFLSDKQPALTVTQMLWVNLIMDTFAALALASLPPTEAVMNDRPRGNGANIITKAMGGFVLGIGLLFSVMMIALFVHLLLRGSGDSFQNAIIDTHERTLFFTTFVFLQFWNLFNAKSFDSGRTAFCNFKESKIFFMVIAVIFIGQILIVEFGGKMFQVEPISFMDWFWIIIGTAPVMLVGEVWHLIKKQ